MGSTQFRNAKSVKDLQKAMGPIPNTVGGKDVHTLRREKRTGRELIAQQNERFIRNRLSKGTIQKPAARVLTPLGSDDLTPIVITDVDG